MDNHASSSRSQPDQPTTAITTPKGPSSDSDKEAKYTWVDKHAESLLKDITKWTRAKDEVIRASINRNRSVPLAKEGTDQDLRYYLEYGSHLAMRYEGCDKLARHCVTGWDKYVKDRFVRRTMMWVLMKERLPGQAPAMDRCDADIKADADREKGEEKGKGKDEEEYRENKMEYEENEVEYEGKKEQKDQDKAN